jgi:beta-glucuronidase
MLSPRTTPTREQIDLDGVWLFGLDSRLGDTPWTSTLTTTLEAAVPASYNDLFSDP